MPEQEENHLYIGDGVYARFDGYGIELRLSDHRSDPVVYLEPSVMHSLIDFYEKKTGKEEEQ